MYVVGIGLAFDVLGKDVGGHAPFLCPPDVPVPDESILAEYQFSFPSRPVRQAGMCWTCDAFSLICFVFLFRFGVDEVGCRIGMLDFAESRLIVALLSEIMGGGM